MSQRMPFQIHIPRRHTKCMKGEELLSAGMEYHSILYEEGDEAFRRYDICSKCWKETDQATILQDACTHWDSQVPEKSEQDDTSRDRNERALELLRDGLETGDPVKNMLLAMLLKRKKAIQYRQELTKEDGGIYHLYEVPATQEMLAIPQVSIAEADIENIQRQITQELQ